MWLSRFSAEFGEGILFFRSVDASKEGSGLVHIGDCAERECFVLTLEAIIGELGSQEIVYDLTVPQSLSDIEKARLTDSLEEGVSLTLLVGSLELVILYQDVLAGHAKLGIALRDTSK